MPVSIRKLGNLGQMQLKLWRLDRRLSGDEDQLARELGERGSHQGDVGEVVARRIRFVNGQPHRSSAETAEKS
jgi:hypothetical protein